MFRFPKSKLCGSKDDLGFTLIELLVVIAILAVLATAVVLVINPAELLKQGRDSTRLSDLAALNSALGLFQVDQYNSSLGTSSVVYVSIPDSSATCANLGLPTLPSGWSYHCAPSSTLTRVDSTGWVPVNLALFSAGSPLARLPIDPVNTTSTGQYYTYTSGGSWELTAFPESAKQKMGGGNDKTSKDGGSYPNLYEVGTNLSLLPVDRDPSLVGYWKLNESSGALYDSSGHGNNGTQSGGVTYGATGRSGNALSFDGTNDHLVVTDSNSLDLISAVSISAWVKLNNIVGTKSIISKASGGFNQQENYYLYLLNSKFTAGVGNADTWQLNGIESPVVVTTDTWYHVAFTADGTNLVISVNGQSNSQAQTITPGTNLYPLYIGSFNGAWFFPEGIIDDVRIYSRALSAAEIQAIYNATQ